MKLLADESVDGQIIERLRADGHTVNSVAEMAPSIADEEVLSAAQSAECPLVTGDKDFGELGDRMSSISQLAHICIHTRDMYLTQRFYTEALGMKLGFEFERKGERFGYYLKAGNMTFIEVFKGDPGAVGNINHLALETPDLDGLITRIRTAGFEVGDKKLGADHSWQAWTEDPNGVRIEFHEYTEKSMQRVGGTCNVDW